MASNLTVGIALKLANEQFNAAARQSAQQFAASTATMRQVVQQDATAIDAAFKVLGTKSFAQVAQEIEGVKASFRTLSDSGVLSQQQLAAAAQAATARIRELSAEAAGFNAKAGQAGQGANALTSSFAGAAKGALALTAAIVGINGGLDALTQAVKAALQLQQFTTALNAVSPSAAAGAQSLAFVRAESDRLGLSLPIAADQFTKLVAAANGTKLAGQGVRDIFTSVASASAVLGLSAEQTSGALTAIQQIISKGTVSAEELRGQLGERLPGAFQIAARSIGVTTTQLQAMLEAGTLIATDFLPKFSAELQRTFGPGVAEASKSARAEFERLKNSVFEAQAAFAQSGFLEGLRDGSAKLREELQKPEVQDALRNLGIALGKLVGFLAQNIEALAKFGAGVLTVAGAMATLSAASAAAASLRVLAASITTTGAAAVASAGSVAVLGRAIAALAALEAGLVIGEQLQRVYDVSARLQPVIDKIFGASSVQATEFAKQLRLIADRTIEVGKGLDEFAIKSQSELASLGPALLGAYQANLERARDYQRALAQKAFADGNELAEKAATARAAAYGRALEDLGKFVTAASGASDTAILKADEGTRKIIEAFTGAKQSGKTTAEAIDKAFENIDLGGSAAKVRPLLIALELLRRDGKLTAEQLQRELTERLGKLDDSGLKNFQTSASNVFGAVGAKAAALAAAMKAELGTSFGQIGVDFTKLTEGITAAEKQIAQAFARVATSSTASGQTILTGFVQALQRVESPKAVQQLIDALVRAGAQGKVSGDQIAVAMELAAARTKALTDTTLQAAQAQTALAQSRLNVTEAQNALIVQQSKTTTAILDAEATRTKYANDYSEAAQRQLDIANAVIRLEQAKTDQQERQISLAKAQGALQEAQNKLKAAEAALQRDQLNPDLALAVARAQELVRAREVDTERATQASIAAKANTSEYETQLTLARDLADQTAKRAAGEGRTTDELRKQNAEAQALEDREKRRQAGATVDIFNADDDIATKIRKVQRAIQDQQVAASKSDIGIQAVVAPYVAQLQAILARLLVEQQNAAVKQRAETQRSTQQTTDIVATGARQASDALRSISDVRVRAPDLSRVDVAIQATQERVTAVRAAIQQLTGFVPLTNLDGTPFANSPATRAATNNGLFFPAPNNPALNAVENANQISAGVIRSGGFSGSTGNSPAAATAGAFTVNITVDGSDLLSPEQVRRKVLPVIEEVARRSR